MKKRVHQKIAYNSSQLFSSCSSHAYSSSFYHNKFQSERWWHTKEQVEQLKTSLKSRREYVYAQRANIARSHKKPPPTSFFVCFIQAISCSVRNVPSSASLPPSAVFHFHYYCRYLKTKHKLSFFFLSFSISYYMSFLIAFFSHCAALWPRLACLSFSTQPSSLLSTVSISLDGFVGLFSRKAKKTNNQTLSSNVRLSRSPRLFFDCKYFLVQSTVQC